MCIMYTEIMMPLLICSYIMPPILNEICGAYYFAFVRRSIRHFLAHLSYAQDELCDHFSSVVVPALTFSNDFSSDAAEPILLKFHMEPP